MGESELSRRCARRERFLYDRHAYNTEASEVILDGCHLVTFVSVPQS